ncbi:unnamed protein product, partial [Discosporangium mesarthrocarpum]
PQGNIVFALPFIPGHTSMHAADVAGLVLVLGGLVVYRFGEQVF